MLQVPRILTVATFEEEEEEEGEGEDRATAQAPPQRKADDKTNGAEDDDGAAPAAVKFKTQARRGSFAFWDIVGGGGGSGAGSGASIRDPQQQPGSGHASGGSGGVGGNGGEGCSRGPSSLGMGSRGVDGHGGGGVGGSELLMDDDEGCAARTDPLRYQGSSGLRSSAAQDEEALVLAQMGVIRLTSSRPTGGL